MVQAVWQVEPVASGHSPEVTGQVRAALYPLPAAKIVCGRRAIIGLPPCRNACPQCAIPNTSEPVQGSALQAVADLLQC